MRAVIQRVSEASVAVDGAVVGACGPGLLILLGVGHGDGDVEAAWLAHKIVSLRIFGDAAGRFDRSLTDVGGSALVVSQFTLFGDASKGNRPSFTGAARPEHAEPLYEQFCELIAAEGVAVARGVFGAMMQVSLVNDGPVTLELERLPAG